MPFAMQFLRKLKHIDVLHGNCIPSCFAQDHWQPFVFSTLPAEDLEERAEEEEAAEERADGERTEAAVIDRLRREAASKLKQEDSEELEDDAVVAADARSKDEGEVHVSESDAEGSDAKEGA